MVYYLMRLAHWLAGRVPRPVRLAIAGPLTVLVYYAWGAKRRVTIANMAQVLGTSPRDPRARKLARDSWRNYGYYLSDLFYLPNATQDEILGRGQDTAPSPGSLDLIEEAQAAGKGVIVTSAHFGAWDVAAVVLASRVPVHGVVESLPDPRMDLLLQNQRRKFGMEVLHIEKSPRPMLRVLQQNGVLAVAVDRPVSPSEGVPVTFFGRTCYVPGGIAQLALRTGAAVVPGACWYDATFSSTFYFAAGPILYPQSTGDKRADTIALMQRIYDALEDVIRPRPEQWAMFRPFWPEGGAETLARLEKSAETLPVTSDIEL
ncbi:MAG: lysophospholipid acyltransferase family protein [Ktedonobacterales bacterium]